jgi:hypothetical protein
MPSEHDEVRARQIQALRRYVVELGTQRERPTQLGVPRDRPTAELATLRVALGGRRRPPLSWLLVTVLLVAVALLGGAFVGAAAWSDDRPSAPAPASGTAAATTQTPRAVPLVASPDCKTAVDRANIVLAVAVRMRAALAQRTDVASGDPASFDRALAEYRQVVDRCALRTP